MILFKLLFGFIGLRIGTAFGAHPVQGMIVGAVLGHAADMIARTKIYQYKARKYYKAKAEADYSRTFFNTLFLMLGKVSLADGKITIKELEAVEKFTTEVLKLKRQHKKMALEIFKSAATSTSSFQLDAAQYFEIHQNDAQALENMILILAKQANADGTISDAEEQLIHSAARVFNITEERYQYLMGYKKSQSQRTNTNGQSQPSAKPPTIERYYEVLGCKPNDSDTTIKQRYRKLVSDYHPDKIVSKELPDDFTKFATEKFKSIQEAYEAVKSMRGFN